jgi:hypothetical protein
VEIDALLSSHAKLIQQLQAADGQTACYATVASHNCYNKECKWRRDCLIEALGAKRKSLNQSQKWRSFHFEPSRTFPDNF